MLHGALELSTPDARGGREHTSSLIDSDDSLSSPEEFYHRTDRPPRCLSFEFLSSYSLREAPDSRTRWRRITMITQVLLFTCWGVMAPLLMFATAHINIRGTILVASFNALFIWSVAWGLALIGDTTGSLELLACFWGWSIETRRKVCGIRPVSSES